MGWWSRLGSRGTEGSSASVQLLGPAMRQPALHMHNVQQHSSPGLSARQMRSAAPGTPQGWPACHPLLPPQCCLLGG